MNNTRNTTSTVCRRIQYLGIAVVLLAMSLLAGVAVASTSPSEPTTVAGETKASISNHWATTEVSASVIRAQPFLIPLGAMKKKQGIWRPEAFEAIQGHVDRTTWSVHGEAVVTLFEAFSKALASQSEALWLCAGRRCGNASEWASQVYGERLLYGRDEFMRYQVFRLASGEWITLFGTARSADRQYLHLDIISPD